MMQGHIALAADRIESEGGDELRQGYVFLRL